MFQKDVDALIPHSGPMKLIDRLQAFEGGRVTVSATPKANGLFVRNGRIRGAVLVEYMAQAVAVFAGLSAKLAGRPIEAGYVIGLSRFEVSVDFVYPGERLTITAERTFGNDDMGNFETTVTRKEARISSATMAVFKGKLDPAADASS